MDYVLVDESRILELDVQVENTPGSTPFAEAGPWHRDLANLSAQKLLDLAKIIWDQKRTERVPEWAVRELLVEAVGAGRIDRSMLQAALRNKVAP